MRMLENAKYLNYIYTPKLINRRYYTNCYSRDQRLLNLTIWWYFSLCKFILLLSFLTSSDLFYLRFFHNVGLQLLFIEFYNTTPIWTMRWSWPLDAWKILINLIWSWSPWSKRILDHSIFRNKFSLNRIWILFVLLQKRKLVSVWKESCSTLICIFYFKSSSSPTQLNFLDSSSSLENKAKS